MYQKLHILLFPNGKYQAIHVAIRNFAFPETVRDQAADIAVVAITTKTSTIFFIENDV